MTNASKRHFAFFITPHGYGHAARAAAVMDFLSELASGAEFEIFTRVPAWFFETSLKAPFHYHDVVTDIGLVQTTSMESNLPETVRQLAALMPFQDHLVKTLARQVREAGSEAVVCDVAALGIAVAREAGLPSFLEENFTWDWMYQGYLDREPAFAPYVAYLRDLYQSVTYHIRTAPASTGQPPADLEAGVVSRRPRTAPDIIRGRLGVPQDIPMILITMGGIVTQYPFLDRLAHAGDIRFLVPGGIDAARNGAYEQHGSLVLIPHHSEFYHPDLTETSNVVIGKLGYSTLAETYSAGVPFAFIPRQDFPETPSMARFATTVMNAEALSEARFFSGDWLDLLPELLSRPRKKPSRPNGGEEIARFLLAHV
jgi:hypothetical protein